MKISVVINTYNAEEYLDEVLASVQLFDEIVVCDMHSTDNTLAIAKKHNCKIVFHEKISFVEPARNFAIQSASYEWVLIVDADEIITKDLREYLYNYIKSNNIKSGLKIPRKNYFMGKFMRSAYPDYCLRFFEKTKVDYPPLIHVPPHVDGEIAEINKKDMKLAIEHLANDSIGHILHKLNYYTDAELEKRKTSKKHQVYLSPFVWFIKYYFLKGACLDGKEGFIFSVLKSFYKFATIAKIIEKRQNSL
jgi:glycosyltransferase involved in cell wall biosynthesis